MGIQGLLPFVQKACKPSSIADFAGCTVAIDGHCWLHKAAYACAERLVKGQKTSQHVAYCLRYIELLRHHKIRPLLVFDGVALPAKSEIHGARREKRSKNLEKAEECERNGHFEEARNLYGQSYQITPQMVTEVIQACREKGVDCLVAPFEADAQLTYLLNQGIVHLVITEDSDLIAFGCKKIFFKMDINGKGTLYERRHLYKCMGGRAELMLAPDRSGGDEMLFTRFRYACILSGCDYIPKGLPGVGLQKAIKAVLSCSNISSIERMLARMPQYLGNMHISIKDDFVGNFLLANTTFLYQIVFDPLLRRQVSLTTVPAEMTKRDLSFTGLDLLTDQKAFLLALGYLMADELDSESAVENALRQAKMFMKTTNARLDSIWTKGYLKPTPMTSPPKTPRIQRRLTMGNSMTMQITAPLKTVISNSLPAISVIEIDGDIQPSSSSSSVPLPDAHTSVSHSTSPLRCKRKLNFDSSNDEIEVPSSPPKKPPLTFSAPPAFHRSLSARSQPAKRGRTRSKISASSQKTNILSSYFSQETTGSILPGSQSSVLSTSSVLVIDGEQDVNDDGPLIAAKNDASPAPCLVLPDSTSQLESSLPVNVDSSPSISSPCALADPPAARNPFAHLAFVKKTLTVKSHL